MCGIIGVVGRETTKKIIEQARDVLAHRGPDDAGLFYDADNQVALGHRRLSIIDLSPAGHQPMISGDGRYVIIFNGEIYNYLELKKELETSYQFATKTDTEVIIYAYDKWGSGCLRKFNGMFAFVIWDKKEKKLFAGRDRLGVKPFFYHLSDRSLLFASEIKALLALGIKAAPNESMIFDYLYHGLYDHTDETFFAGINVLPPGHYLTWTDGQTLIAKYWDAADIKANTDLNETEAREQFTTLLSDSIQLRFRSDVPVGVNLSSGLDSNSIYHYALEVTGGKLHTFSMCSESPEYPEYNECAVLDRVLSNDQKQYWHTSTLTPAEVFAQAVIINQKQDQPFGGVPTVAYQKMIGLAKEAGITVLLEGQGVDELLAGYAYYQNPPTSLATSQDSSKLVHQDVLRGDFADSFSLRKNISFPAPFASPLLNAQYRDLRYTKLPRVLRFNDHATMAYGRELRLPFLDYRLVEFCFALPDQYKIRNHNQKVLLREAMKDIVPPLVQQTQKKGFGAIQTEWFRQYFKDEVYALLDAASFKSRPFWDHKKLKERVDEFYQGKYNNSFFIWQCFNLEMWFREYIDKSSNQ